MNSKSSTLVEKCEDFVPSAVGTKPKSLRQLARELGVSPAYLSQVKNGKRPASVKLLSNAHVARWLDTEAKNPSYPRLQVGCATIAPLGHSASNTI